MSLHLALAPVTPTDGAASKTNTPQDRKADKAKAADGDDFAESLRKAPGDAQGDKAPIGDASTEAEPEPPKAALAKDRSEAVEAETAEPRIRPVSSDVEINVAAETLAPAEAEESFAQGEDGESSSTRAQPALADTAGLTGPAVQDQRAADTAGDATPVETAVLPIAKPDGRTKADATAPAASPTPVPSPDEIVASATARSTENAVATSPTPPIRPEQTTGRLSGSNAAPQADAPRDSAWPRG
ncbi:MAG: hypothetical protein AAFU61_02040, partial [Pseudomonadota bacterium]